MSHNWAQMETDTQPANNDKLVENNKVEEKKIENKKEVKKEISTKPKHSLRYCHYVESDEEE